MAARFGLLAHLTSAHPIAHTLSPPHPLRPPRPPLQALKIDPACRGAEAHVIHSNLSAVYAALHEWTAALTHGQVCVSGLAQARFCKSASPAPSPPLTKRYICRSHERRNLPGNTSTRENFVARAPLFENGHDAACVTRGSRRPRTASICSRQCTTLPHPRLADERSQSQ